MVAAVMKRPFFTLLGTVMVSAGITMLFLAMRDVMNVGGACASGATPYVSAVPCPNTAWMAPVGIFGGLIGLFMAGGAKPSGAPTVLPFAWSALFLALGWNFAEFGVNPPDGSSVAVGWIVCAVLFGLMGGLPLLLLLKPKNLRKYLWGLTAAEQEEQAQRLIAFGARRQQAKQAQRAPQPQRAHSPQRDPLVGQLERLTALHKSGALSDEEFGAAKEKLLRGPK
jgi:hypothetical protein